MRSQDADRQAGYLLGYSGAEQDRLIRQAMLLAPISERLFREAGIGTGQRVLDVGAGLGDVSMIAARLAGPSGEVVGVERDAGYRARAAERVAALGLRNVRFIQGDLNDLAVDGPFDAAVGRLVLNYVRDTVAVLRAVSRRVIPGGAVAFQEVAWSPTLAVGARVPLWSRLVGAIHEIFARSGADTERGLDLHRDFQDAGLPAPHMHLDMLLAADRTFAELQTGLLRALRPAAEQHGVPLGELGDLDTLPERIHAEIVSANSVIGFVAIVSAWSRKPA